MLSDAMARAEEFELLGDEASFEALEGSSPSKSVLRVQFTTRLLQALRIIASRPYRLRITPKRLFFAVKLLLAAAALLLFLTAVLFPSYTHKPSHYAALQQRIQDFTYPGRGNPSNEKVFISISLYDKGGHLAGGRWAQNILGLIELLGYENTFLSVYENDSGEDGASALKAFENHVPCAKQIVVEDVDKSSFPKVTMADGTKKVKRLVYLSEMRNRALRPLNSDPSTRYDKVLFLNDVFFDPIDAIQLLFSTNMGADGKANYTAACALDFHENPIKFYDVFATRDLEGYSMGVPFYPFFSHAGKAQSRSDILSQKDAVRVKSCWSGMAAFDAQYIQSSASSAPHDALSSNSIDPERPHDIVAPARFRAEPEVYFDACECCLLMADVIKLAKGTTNVGDDSGVYVNPYVRVAYSQRVLWWLKYSRRVERAYTGIHFLVDSIARMPTYNHHRAVTEGMAFKEEVWIPDLSRSSGGYWEIKERQARTGLYCGVREMQTLLESPRKEDKNWKQAVIPGGRQLF